MKAWRVLSEKSDQMGQIRKADSGVATSRPHDLLVIVNLPRKTNALFATAGGSGVERAVKAWRMLCEKVGGAGTRRSRQPFMPSKQSVELILWRSVDWMSLFVVRNVSKMESYNNI